MSRITIPLFVLAAAVAACGQPGKEATPAGDERAEMQRPAGLSPLFEALPAEAPAPADNPTSAERVALGHKLFFEPKLSRSGTISCNTCHVVGAAGVDNRSVAMGEGARTGPRNSPTVFNAAFLKAQFWDGRAPTLEEQAKGPIQAHVEMDLTPSEAVQRLRETGYAPLFAEAFDSDTTALTFDNLAKAIAAFERTLLTPGAPFDHYLAGDTAALGPDARAGLALFQQAGCLGCHNGPLLGGNGYANFSHVQGSKDVGRAAVTKSAADNWVFRIAPLRNIALTHPYFHNGSARTLEDAVAIMGNSQLKRTFTADEVRQFVAFLTSLTGEFPSVPYPQLPRAFPAPPPASEP